MDRKTHWEAVYSNKAANEVSWYRPHLEVSIELIGRYAASKGAMILDVGGGASTLVDDLLNVGFEDISVLDVAETALDVARRRLGSTAAKVRWLATDFLNANLEPQKYDICHDRAVFHFLVDAEDRKRYFKQVEYILRSKGTLILATFAREGPSRCSGLEVSRYGETEIKEVAGEAFELVFSQRERHLTPQGNMQEMMYFVLQRSTSSTEGV